MENGLHYNTISRLFCTGHTIIVQDSKQPLFRLFSTHTYSIYTTGDHYVCHL